MNTYEVYEWIDLTSGEPFYVGRGKGGRKYISNRSLKFNNRIKDIGIENCAVVVLHKKLNEIESGQLEVWYINEYRYIFGFDLCNILDGGEGGKQNIIRTNDHKMKISESLNSRSEKDKQIWKKKISIKNNGKVFTDEERKRVSDALRGRKLNESQMRSLKGRVGEKNPFYGKHHTPKTKEKIAKRMMGRQNPFASKFKAIFPNGDEMIFETRKELELHFKEKYDMSSKPLTNLYNGGEPFNPRWKKYQHLKGLQIIKLNQKH